MSEIKNRDILVDKLKNTYGHAILSTNIFCGEVTHVVDIHSLVSICGYIKNDPDFKMDYMVDVIGVDYLGQTPRFEVVYHFYSTAKKHRIRLKIKVEDGQEVPTISHLWAGADWPEREAYDMFGIVFSGHPDMRRIYLAHDWVGHPLRKDYPLRGYKDRYNPYGEEKEEDDILA